MKELELKYGCNPNQKPARVFMENGDLPITVVNGRPGYINLLDALNGWQLVKELKEATGLPAATSFKHVSPAGAAVGLPLSDTLKKIYFTDNVELTPLACAYARARGADRDNAIDLYIGEDYMDVLADGAWENTFKVKPPVFTREEKRAWLDQMQGVALGSDAFFPFGDNIERAHKSGVQYVAQPGGSIRDDNVIETCNKYGMAMCFTGIRLFHH